MTEALVTALAAALAGRQRTVLAPPGKRVAAVLVPLLAVEGEPSLLFTRRSNLLPHHQGQIAFPGGVHDPDADPDLAATALREAREEIGLDPTHVRLLGPLDDLETVATRFVITPFVGVVPHPYEFQPCPDEVDLIFTVPLGRLASPDALRRELWDFGGRQVPIDVYAVDRHVIWGATQRITGNLLAVLDELA